jgi:hypothetical protein
MNWDESSLRTTMTLRSLLISFGLTVGISLILASWLHVGSQLSTNAQTAQVTVIPTQLATYLPNPGIGWQEAHTDPPLLPETVAYKRSEYGWQMQNPQPNVYDWSAVDTDLQATTNQGKQLSFRIYTMKGPGFGGHQMPQWVLNQGATLLDGSPNYSNCTYQEQWGTFVNAMRQKYDGNPNIAFVDISRYGNFNEWSWTDGQTVFDEDPINNPSIDTQARKRLIDMFIGGSGTIQCRNADNSLRTVSYSYPGFQQTQLVMPYAGIRQSNEYVVSRRQDVGVRHDCLGRADNDIMEKIGGIITQLWPNAPMVFEFCGNANTTTDLLSRADQLLKQAHGSIAHDNFNGSRNQAALENILTLVGYRFTLIQAQLPTGTSLGSTIPLVMTWQNVGYAPNYPKMGQVFDMKLYLHNEANQVVHTWDVPVSTKDWLPDVNLTDQIVAIPNQTVATNLDIPTHIVPGTYQLKVALIERRTGQPINLAFEGRDAQGHYLITPMVITDLGSSPTPTPTATPTTPPSPTPTTCPRNPDVNGNGMVDYPDYHIIQDEFFKEDLPLRGDIDCSGVVDLWDYHIWADNIDLLPAQ